MNFQNNGALVLNGSEAVDFGTTTDAGICANFIENAAYDIIVGSSFGPHYQVNANYNSPSTSAITATGTVQIEFTCNIDRSPDIKCYYTNASGNTSIRDVGTTVNVTVNLYRKRGSTSTNLGTINFVGASGSLFNSSDSKTVVDNVLPGDRFYMSWSAVNTDGNANGCWGLEAWYGVISQEKGLTGHLKISARNNSF